MIGPLFVGAPGALELAIIVLVIIVLFGPNEIPRLARALGEAQAEYEKSRDAGVLETTSPRGTNTTTSEPATDPVRV